MRATGPAKTGKEGQTFFANLGKAEPRCRRGVLTASLVRRRTTPQGPDNVRNLAYLALIENDQIFE